MERPDPRSLSGNPWVQTTVNLLEIELQVNRDQTGCKNRKSTEIFHPGGFAEVKEFI